jgi:hypothetical protein
MTGASARGRGAHIVVAHYNEDLSWLARYDPGRVTIYSKGEPADARYGRVLRLPNLGREAHTYLTFIVDHYDGFLAAHATTHVCFLQGNPHDHLGPDDLRRRAEPDGDADCSHVGFDTLDTSRTYALHDMRLDSWRGEATDRNALPFDEWFLRFVEPDLDPRHRDLQLQGGANMTVSTAQILSRPRRFYEALLAEVQSPNPEAGHYLERSWYYIFNLHNKHGSGGARQQQQTC